VPRCPARSAGRTAFRLRCRAAIYPTVLHRLMVSGSDRHAYDWNQRLRIHGAETLTLESTPTRPWLDLARRPRTVAP
jgi:hypothetical protein